LPGCEFLVSTQPGISATGKPSINVTGGSDGMLCGGILLQVGISGTPIRPTPISGISGTY